MPGLFLCVMLPRRKDLRSRSDSVPSFPSFSLCSIIAFCWALGQFWFGTVVISRRIVEVDQFPERTFFYLGKLSRNLRHVVVKVKFRRDVEPPADPLFRGNVEWCIPCVCGFAPPKFVPVTAAAAFSRLSWEHLPSSVGPILHLTHSPLTPDPSVLRLLSLHPPYSKPSPIFVLHTFYRPPDSSGGPTPGAIPG